MHEQRLSLRGVAKHLAHLIRIRRGNLIEVAFNMRLLRRINYSFVHGRILLAMTVFTQMLHWSLREYPRLTGIHQDGNNVHRYPKTSGRL